MPGNLDLITVYLRDRPLAERQYWTLLNPASTGDQLDPASLVACLAYLAGRSSEWATRGICARCMTPPEVSRDRSGCRLSETALAPICQVLASDRMRILRR